MLDLITGGAGTGKSYEMSERIGKCVDGGGKPFILVPDQFNFEYNKLLYAHLGMERFNKTEALGFSRLAQYVFTALGGLKGRYADDTVRSIVMFRTLNSLNAEKALNFYARQAKSRRFIPDALEFVKTFSANNVPPELLADKAVFAANGVKDKLADISLIYSRYTELLAAAGFKDGHTDISEAAKKASDGGFFKGMDIFIDEFKSFTPDEYALLEVITADANSLTVCLTTDEQAPKKLSVFSTTGFTLAKLSGFATEHKVKVNRTTLTENRRFAYPELEFLSKNVLRSTGFVYGGEKSADMPVRIYEAAEPYDEADFVAAEINRLVRDKNLRYSDITVLSRQKENYSSILEAAFERGGVPFYSDESMGIAHKALIIFIQTALTLASEKTPQTEEWLRYIKTDYAGIDGEQADIIEEYCYKWSVEGKMWSEPFRITDKTDGDEPSNDEIAEEARLKVTAPIEKLRAACENASAADICKALLAFTDDVKLCDKIKASSDETDISDAAVLAAIRETRQLWDMLCGVLQTIYAVLGSEPISLTEFAGLFSVIVSGLKLSSPPQTLDAVTFAASNMARLANPSVVFVIGANEGVLPYAVKPSALITDKDLTALRACGIELAGGSAENIAEERYVAYASLSAASRRLYVTYPMATVSGGALYPALTVKQLSTAFGEEIVFNARKLGLLYFCTTPESAYYQFVQNYRRRDCDSASLRKALELYSSANAERFAFLEKLGSAEKHTLSRKNGLTDRIFGKSITMSASRFEDYRKCPFVYFCKKGLNLYPSRKIKIDAPSQGSAIHYCLSEIMRAISKDELISMPDEFLRKLVDRRLNDFYESEEIGGSYGKTKRFIAAFTRLSDTVSDILIQMRDELMQSKFVPSSFEYKLMTNGDELPVKLSADDGTDIYFIGAVDRIDTYVCDGITYIRVVDYKSGTKIFSVEDLYYGVNMQMLLYLFALTNPDAPVKSGAYRAAVPAGVLYMPAKDAAPELPRNADESSLKEARCGTYKMDGLVLADTDIVRAMEKDALGVYIPVRLKKDDGFYLNSKVISDTQLENLRHYSEELLKETASMLKNGRIEANPLTHGLVSPCTNCDYKSICGNFPNITAREYSEDAKEKINKIINGEKA